MLGRAGFIVVIASLLVIMVYSSVAQLYNVYARPKINTATLCQNSTPTVKGAVSAQTCCKYNVVFNGLFYVYTNIISCEKCQTDSAEHVLDCTTFYPRQTPGGNSPNPPSSGTVLPNNNTGGITNGQTGLPGRLGTVLPPSGNNTGTPGKTSIFNPLRNATTALPGNNSAGALPPGTTTAPGNNTGPLPPQTITKEHNPASPNVFSPAGNTTTNASSNTNSTGH